MTPGAAAAIGLLSFMLVVGVVLGLLLQRRQNALIATLTTERDGAEERAGKLETLAGQRYREAQLAQAEAANLRDRMDELTGTALPAPWELAKGLQDVPGLVGACAEWSTHYFQGGVPVERTVPRLFSTQVGAVGSGKLGPLTASDTSVHEANVITKPGRIVVITVELRGAQEADLDAFRAHVSLMLELGSIIVPLSPLAAWSWSALSSPKERRDGPIGNDVSLVGAWEVAPLDTPAPPEDERVQVASSAGGLLLRKARQAAPSAGWGMTPALSRFAVLANMGDCPTPGREVRMRVTLGIVPEPALVHVRQPQQAAPA